ncbi:MAG: GNAT family N-acetyltransferase, partial [Oscillospiraceae bacterium]
NIIVGFGDMDNNGYFDRLYVHKDYQGKGIAAAIATELERLAEMQGILAFSTHASVTAKPFFEKRGYCVVRENKVIRNGVELTNFIMEKSIAK